MWHNKEDDSLSLQVQVLPTICEVRGVERQPAAQVLINPPAGFEEIFTLRTEGKRLDCERGRTGQLQQRQFADVDMPVCAICRQGK